MVKCIFAKNIIIYWYQWLTDPYLDFQFWLSPVPEWGALNSSSEPDSDLGI